MGQLVEQLPQHRGGEHYVARFDSTLYHLALSGTPTGTLLPLLLVLVLRHTITITVAMTIAISYYPGQACRILTRVCLPRLAGPWRRPRATATSDVILYNCLSASGRYASFFPFLDVMLHYFVSASRRYASLFSCCLRTLCFMIFFLPLTRTQRATATSLTRTLGYGLRFSTEIYGSKQEKTVFHKNPQELGGTTCLALITCLIRPHLFCLCVVCRVQDHHHLLHNSPLLKI